MAAQKLPWGRKNVSATGADTIDVEFVAQQECVVDLQIEKPATSTVSVSKVSAGGATEPLISPTDTEITAATSAGMRGLRMMPGDQLHVDVSGIDGLKVVTAEAFKR